MTQEEQLQFDSLKQRVETLSKDIETLKSKPVSLPYPLSYNDQEILKKWLKQDLSTTLFEVNWDNYLYYHTFFEGADVGMQSSYDAGSGGNVGPGGVGSFGAITLSTGNVSGNETDTTLVRQFQNILDYNNKQRFVANFYFQTYSNVEAYLSNNEPTDAYGFHIVDNQLKGFVGVGGVTTEIVLATLTAGTVYEVEARLNPLDKVIFYLDNVELGVLSTLPTGTNTGIIYMYIKTTDNVNKDMTVERWELIAQK